MVFGSALIVFRETLEAALFVGIVAAATGHVPGRTRWLALGVAAGAVGSLALAASMDAIAAWADGMGQDLVSAVLLSMALCLLAWHAIQAPRHARQAAQEAKRMGSRAAEGQGSLMALSGAVALAVLREGVETVLFIAGTLSGGAAASGGWMLGAAMGLGAGALAGWLVCRGLGKIRPARLFAVTNGLILLLAGSLASQLAQTLSQANWLTVLGDKAWDVSAWLPNESPLGSLLHGLVGYDASPSQLQLLFFLGTAGFIALAARRADARLRATLTVGSRMPAPPRP